MPISDRLQPALLALQQHQFAEVRRLMAGIEQPFTLHEYLVRGLAEIGCQDWQVAAVTFRDATRAFPQHAAFWSNLGTAEENLGNDAAAADAFLRSLQNEDANATAHGNLSNIFYRLGKPHDAEAHARQALQLGAPRGAALNSLGLALARLGRYGEAETAFAEARQISPHDPLIHFNIANVAIDQFKFDEAWPAFDDALRLSARPEISRDAGMARLLAGDYEQGWTLYEKRLDLPGALHRACALPRFVGGVKAPQSLVLISEQGFGDTIQFCRYGSLLAAQGHALIWMVQPQLVRLLQGQLPGRVISHKDEMPEADATIPLMSLPFTLGLFDPAQAPHAPYLKAPQHPRLPESSGKRKVGLVWAGSPTHKRDYERSIPFENFSPLLARDDVQFYAAFTGKALDDIGPAPVQRLDHLITDFADTAALIAQLDVLLTVDTAVAHLAGALGVKTWLLLPRTPDWRWGTSSQATPWYNNMLLFRASASGAWAPVIADIAKMLDGES